MNIISAPRPERCTFCGTVTSPQIRQVNTSTHIIKEAHYVCPHCANRFKSGQLSKEEIK